MKDELKSLQNDLADNKKKAPFNSIWKHVKSGGLYEFGYHVIVESNMTLGVTYWKLGRASIVWFRPAEEFFDGRFVLMEIDYESGKYVDAQAKND